MEFLRRLYREEDGQALTEYGLVLAIVVIAIIGALVLLKDKLIVIFTKVTDALGKA